MDRGANTPSSVLLISQIVASRADVAELLKKKKPQISQTAAERIRGLVLVGFYPSTPTRQPPRKSALVCSESDPTAGGNPESFGCAHAARPLGYPASTARPRSAKSPSHAPVSL